MKKKASQPGRSARKKHGGHTKKACLRSMTGFGKGAAKTSCGTITVEIKTLNHKQLSITCNAFDGFFLLEERLKEVFEKKLARGKVFVRITVEGKDSIEGKNNIRINENAARNYIKKVKYIQKKLSIGGEIQIQDVLMCPGVVENVEQKNESKTWKHIKKATDEALKALIQYREAEGSKLAKDFAKRIKKIQKTVRDIRKYEKKSIEEYRSRLAGMIRQTIEPAEINKTKLEEEVALFARNCDIEEETVRLASHLDAYKEILESSQDEVGKKLDFIAQEMHREANTIGSKASDYRISNAVIEIKSEIEKIREQLKNIE